jgi:ferredoxin-NADP reductase/predicted pyridoxine 5'-phosphate oxidase superfamily flavin-nucleotide-binding protein
VGHRFAELAFTESVREVQEALGSRASYTSMEGGEDYNHVLGEREADFIRARDSFYMASVSETGWPYVQHRGGPAGFVRILDERTIGFADFRGNRQYVSVGNLQRDDRVALFFMDYPNRVRLKLLGRVELVGLDSTALADLEVPDYRARVERGFLVRVEAFDWNCPQHITPRYTDSEIQDLLAPLIEENRALKAAPADAHPVRPKLLGNGPLELVISGVRELTPRIRAYELRDPSGAALPAIEAGAHLEVPIRVDNSETAVRHYSICSDPARRDAWEIAVLREDAGRGGSRAVHELFEIGLRLRCGQPQNNFALHADARPTVLIAGGIGITPIKAMALAMKARGTAMQVHYAGRSRQEMAFRRELQREISAELTIYNSADGERMDVERILTAAPDDAVIYVCGPARLVDAALRVATALKIDPDRVRFERFAAAVPSDARPVGLELRRSGKQLRVPADQSLLDAILEAGVDASFGCRAGSCKSCAVKVLGGEPDHRDSALSTAERENLRLMCPCVSRATSDHLVLDI